MARYFLANPVIVEETIFGKAAEFKIHGYYTEPHTGSDVEPPQDEDFEVTGVYLNNSHIDMNCAELEEGFRQAALEELNKQHGA